MNKDAFLILLNVWDEVTMVRMHFWSTDLIHSITPSSPLHLHIIPHNRNGSVRHTLCLLFHFTFVCALSAGQRDSHPLSLQFPLLTTRCDNNSMMEVNGAVNVENISNIQYICQIATFFQNQILNAAVNEVLFELNWYTVYAGGLHNRNCGWSATDRQRLCRGKIRCVHNSY